MRAEALSALIDATWTPAARRERDGWMIREGQGAGSRVSAATALAPGNGADPSAAVAAMQALGQRPIFMVRPGEAALDAALAGAGFAVVTPTLVHRAPVGALADARAGAIEVWPPSEAERGIWAEGGIGPARLAVMDRVEGPKTACTVHEDGAPVATGFGAVHGETLVLHAIETLAAHRRRGHARRVIGALAAWGARQGAGEVALLVVEANLPANALYARMGFTPEEAYHYRAAPEAG